MHIISRKALHSWATIGPLLVIHNERNYDCAIERLHRLLDEVGTNEGHHLMEEHGLTQSDLPEIGSQGVVSELLRAKRELNVRQIRALSQRFSVSPAVFF